MAWQPEEDGLRQLSEYLKNSLSGHDRNKQKEAEQVSSLYLIRECKIGKKLERSGTEIGRGFLRSIVPQMTF